jgi:tight adherence protein B
MDILNLQAGPAYAMGLVGVFLGVSLLLAGTCQLIVKPLLARQEIRRRMMNRGNNQRLGHVQILKDVQEIEDSLWAAIAKRIGALGKIENLQRNLMQADIYWRPATFLSVAGFAACGGFLVAFLKYGFLPAMGAAFLCGNIPFFVMRLKKNHKTKVIEKQMPEAMELLARSLRAGHALPSSIELAGKEIPDPLGTEMKTVYEEQRLGLSVPMALKRMGERVASQDLQFFVTAVMLQTETGGNLAEVMENIGYLIRERLKLKGKIQALTAEGKFSALILALLPFVVFFALTIVNRKYIETLFTDPAGIYIIGIGLFNIVIGIVWMKNIIKLDV